MLKKYGVLAIVGLLVIAGIGVIFFSGGASGSDDLEGELTVFVEDIETGTILSGTVDIGEMSVVETMMLSLGQGIRTTEMEPLTSFDATTKEPIKATSYYNIWTSARIHVSADEIVEVTTNAVHFACEIVEPLAGDGLYSSSSSNKVIDAYDYLELNQDTVINMAEDLGKKWTHAIMEGASSTKQIQGANLNNMKLHVEAFIGGEDSTGREYLVNTHAHLTIHVSSWAEAVLTISVTAMGPGSDSPSVTIVPALGENKASA